MLTQRCPQGGWGGLKIFLGTAWSPVVGDQAVPSGSIQSLFRTESPQGRKALELSRRWAGRIAVGFAHAMR